MARLCSFSIIVGISVLSKSWIGSLSKSSQSSLCTNGAFEAKLGVEICISLTSMVFSMTVSEDFCNSDRLKLSDSRLISTTVAATVGVSHFPDNTAVSDKGSSAL
uniref:Uncharacterized protein n=1 Tax=Glossina palpalis gambiensis TaxID=67801 RepID=A0A1B0C5K1_9MUSC